MKKECVICGNTFSIERGLSSFGRFMKGSSPANKKTCSNDCRFKLQRKIAKDQIEKNKTISVIKKCKYCSENVVSTKYCPQNFCNGKYGECYRKYLSESRMGEKNPAYKNGLSVIGKRKYTGIHLRACAKYRKKFLDKNDYLYCEVCNINQNGTYKFEVHHIYYASLYPKHKNLHDDRNLILLCIQCHNDFHSGKMRSDKFLQLEKERGLKKLFE